MTPPNCYVHVGENCHGNLGTYSRDGDGDNPLLTPTRARSWTHSCTCSLPSHRAPTHATMCSPPPHMPHTRTAPECHLVVTDLWAPRRSGVLHLSIHDRNSRRRPSSHLVDRAKGTDAWQVAACQSSPSLRHTTQPPAAHVARFQGPESPVSRIRMPRVCACLARSLRGRTPSP